MLNKKAHNARLRGWQRTTTKLKTTTVTTAAHWDWKRRALTVPLKAFVIQKLSRTHYTLFLFLLRESQQFLMAHRNALFGFESRCGVHRGHH